MFRLTLRTILGMAAAGLGAAACGAPMGPATSTGSVDCLAPTADGHPTNLACTGLYVDAASDTIRPDVDAYDPSISLWADGATKRRFIHLPPHTTIDSSDPDHWVFPNGTKLWKEFSLGGQRLETRYLEKQTDGTWFRTVYEWNEIQTGATEVTGGVNNVDGTGYDVPSQAECPVCHNGAPGGVLGFEAVGLSTPGATGLTLAELARRGLLSAPPAAPSTIPGTPTESAALGWLHANCGNACHNRTEGALASGTMLFMRLTSARMGTVEATDTFVSAVNVVSGFQPIPGETFLRIDPGDVALSAIAYRASRRDTPQQSGVQMPPFGTHIVDAAGVALVDAWITGMPHAPDPSPAASLVTSPSL